MSEVMTHIPIEFARTLYHLNILSKENYNTMTKMQALANQSVYMLTKLLMEDISNPEKYDIFKTHLRMRDSLERLHQQIYLVG